MFGDSVLFIENVGPALGRYQFSREYFNAWMRDSKSLGTYLNDLLPGNYGQGFRAFDPVHDSVTKSILTYGAAAAGVGGTAAGACLAGALGCQ